MSDVSVARELRDGRLVKASAITLPGYGFYLVHDADSPRRELVDVFSSWALGAS